MILTIWRHGEAEEGPVDQNRELTDSGCDDVGFGCRQLHKACSIREIPQPDIILYSPLVRAVQTARIIAGIYTHASASAEIALQPGNDLGAVSMALSGIADSNPDADHLLVVSHQPLVSRLVDHYLGEAGVVPSLSAGGLVTVSLELFEPACASLHFWSLPPEYETGP
jgi:phosphohistidine phosphatase